MDECLAKPIRVNELAAVRAQKWPRVTPERPNYSPKKAIPGALEPLREVLGLA